MSVVRQKILIVASVAGVALVLLLSADALQKYGWKEQPSALLEGPLRLTAKNPETVQSLLLGLRVYHYRARPRGQETAREFYYDTSDWQLHDQGVSLSLRIDTKPSGKQKYTAQLVAMGPRGDESAEPSALLSGIPTAINEKLISSKWDLQLAEKFGFDPERFQEVFRGLGVATHELALQLQGSLVRDRFHVTDKGRTWFEFDHEHWTLRRSSAESGSTEFEIHDLVIELREHRGAADLARRAKTMEEFALSMYPLEVSHLSPRERAIIALREP